MRLYPLNTINGTSITLPSTDIVMVSVIGSNLEIKRHSTSVNLVVTGSINLFRGNGFFQTTSRGISIAINCIYATFFQPDLDSNKTKVTLDGESIVVDDTQSNIITKANKSSSDNSGVDYEVVAGALRNNGGTWELIDDTDHCGMNISSIQTLNNPTIGDFIRVNFGTTFDKICTFIVGSDESYVADFTFGGASVTTSYADIVVSKLVSTNSYIFYNGSAWDFLGDDVTLSYSAGVLTITHDNVKKLNVNGISRNNPAFDLNIGGVTETITQVYFYDKGTGAQYTGVPTTDMKIFFSRIEGRPITHAESANGAGEFKNLWFDGKFKA